MFVKKFGVALAAGLVAVACATPAALAADAVKDAEAAVKSAQLDVDYFCNEESVYYPCRCRLSGPGPDEG